MKIAITGVSGFIGSYLCEYLLENTDCELVSLSRSELQSHNPRLHTRKCDLYSQADIRAALEDVDIAIYLVHSMAPSSRLSQGSFRDFDYLLADNFAKAAHRMGVKRIIYVGGLVGKGESSQHLESRLEVEQTLMRSPVPATSLRCGIVMGPGGSSFTMVQRLVRRLPMIALPKWTQTESQVVSIRDLIKVIHLCIEGDEDYIGSFDVASSQPITYADLIKLVAKKMGFQRAYLELPYIPVSLSKRWVAYITGYSKQLVYPLVDSLVHPMLVQEKRRFPRKDGSDFESVESGLDWSLSTTRAPKLPVSRVQQHDPNREPFVQSVQRLPAPRSWKIKRVAEEYMNWLPKHLGPFLQVRRDGNWLHFVIPPFPPLLILEFAEDVTTPDRELFWIRGGLLAKKSPKGRLEFRDGPTSKCFIAAIHSFKPRLPWFIYRLTQAPMHKWVMFEFGKHLAAQKD